MGFSVVLRRLLVNTARYEGFLLNIWKVKGSGLTLRTSLRYLISLVFIDILSDISFDMGFHLLRFLRTSVGAYQKLVSPEVLIETCEKTESLVAP